MATLERRLHALENRTTGGLEAVFVFRKLIVPCVPAGEVGEGEALGQRFTRAASETETQFLDRLREFVIAHRGPTDHRPILIWDENDLSL